MFFVVFPKVFKQPKKPSGKPIKKKFLKVSDSPLDMGFVFLFLVFPKVFTKPTNPSRKPQIPKKTKENQKTFEKTKNTKDNKKQH